MAYLKEGAIDLKHIDGRVAIWGIGKRFVQHEEELFQNYNVIFLGDNGKEKQGRTYHGLTVQGFDELARQDFDYVLIVPQSNKIQIADELIGRGVPPAKIVLWFPGGGHTWDNFSFYWKKNQYIGDFDGIKVAMETADEFGIMEEIFLQNSYGFWVGNEPSIVIDIGMNVGMATLFFASRHNVERIYGFEPFPATYQRALENISMNQENIQRKIEPHMFGLSNYDAIKRFAGYNKDHSGWMGIESNAAEATAAEDFYEIYIKDAGTVLKAILKRHEGKSVILKIDTEGSEYRIFESLTSSHLWECFRVILMETHGGKENVLKHTLEQNGFAYFDNYIGGIGRCGMLKAIRMGR